jgi:3-hydroxyacyl-[acyl-carrier-protein] dehydratase
MQQMEEILQAIPHRPPFLWVDRIISCEEDSIVTEKDIPSGLDILQGHYPGNPIMPGVILCEAIFQSGALLMAKKNIRSNANIRQIPVLTKIAMARFKKQVFPGDTVQIKVVLTEMMSTACFFHGILKVSGKIAVTVDFVCAMVQTPASNHLSKR